LENDCPLVGIDKVPTVSIEDAVEAALPILEMTLADFQPYLRQAKKKAKRLLKGESKEILLADEIAAVNIYTQETPFYGRLNYLLRNRSRTKLKPAFCYLKLLLMALHKLTPLTDTVYRGVTKNLSAWYPKGREIVWWAFSSATASLDVLQSEQFLGKSGSRTLFTIKVQRVFDIKRYSAIAAEEERLIMPGTPFTVKSILDVGSGLTMVQLEQDPDEECLIYGFP
jgi:hypothetical protein